MQGAGLSDPCLVCAHTRRISGLLTVRRERKRSGGTSVGWTVGQRRCVFRAFNSNGGVCVIPDTEGWLYVNSVMLVCATMMSERPGSRGETVLMEGARGGQGQWAVSRRSLQCRCSSVLSQH